MSIQLITPFIKEAIQTLCATYYVIFHTNYYEDIEVIGMEKPTWEEVTAKADEIELAILKPYYAKQVKNLELEARKELIGDSSEILVSHWNNQKIIAEKILLASHTPSEYVAFQDEIDLRGLGETMEEFCNKVLNNSAVYERKNCRITGALKKATLAIETSLTKEEALIAVEEFKQDILASNLLNS
jgi:hypothetical protein